MGGNQAFFGHAFTISWYALPGFSSGEPGRGTAGSAWQLELQRNIYFFFA